MSMLKKMLRYFLFDDPEDRCCSKCGLEQWVGYEKCQKCGVEFPNSAKAARKEQYHQVPINDRDYIRCSKCGFEQWKGYESCQKCGVGPLIQSSKQETEKKSSYTSESQDQRIIVPCLNCKTVLRFVFCIGKHQFECPICRKVFLVLVREDKSIQFMPQEAEISESIETPWYKVLEIPQNSTRDEIKLALRKQMQQYHPDKVATLGKEIRDLAERKTRDIILAYEQALAEKDFLDGETL